MFANKTFSSSRNCSKDIPPGRAFPDPPPAAVAVGVALLSTAEGILEVTAATAELNMDATEGSAEEAAAIAELSMDAAAEGSAELAATTAELAATTAELTTDDSEGVRPVAVTVAVAFVYLVALELSLSIACRVFEDGWLLLVPAPPASAVGRVVVVFVQVVLVASSAFVDAAVWLAGVAVVST